MALSCSKDMETEVQRTFAKLSVATPLTSGHTRDQTAVLWTPRFLTLLPEAS